MYKPNVFLINSGYDGCNYVRIYLPCVHNGYKTDKPSRSENRIEMDNIKQELVNADVVVFHRAEEQEYHDLAKILKANGKKIVMDNDDTFLLEDFHPLAQFQPDGTPHDNLKRRSDNIDEFMNLCDMVTTTTKTLAGEYRKQNDNVVILPNYVDPDDWDEPLRNEGKKVRIGLVGSVAMEYDYIHLKYVIRKLSERDDVEIVMFGLGDKEHRKNNPVVTKVFKDEYKFWDSIDKEHFPWVKNHLYPETLNEMRLDMMLIPRKDNYFNRCKSNLKFLEAGMCEIPVIAQSFDDGPYEEITEDTGVLITDNSKWEEEIEKLIQDKELRRAIGKKAKEYVLKNYDINDNAHKWETAYSSLF
jgi:glycosyltransferase involved in cell wall biosynthesis